MTDTEINWTPLERFTAIMGNTPIPTNPLGVTSLNAHDFMYMGTSEPEAHPNTIYLYKHIDTRRYLNLDAAGHAYQYVGSANRYFKLDSALDAVRLVLS